MFTAGGEKALIPCRSAKSGMYVRDAAMWGKVKLVDAEWTRLGRPPLSGGCRATSWAARQFEARAELVTADRLGQALTAAIWWRWSLVRLWVAISSRHSVLTAILPLRWNRLISRLCLVCANTGSIIWIRLR